MKAMLWPLQSRLTSENRENCLKLKATKDVIDLEQLAKTMQDQSSH